MNSSKLLALTIAALLVPTLALAASPKVYKWVDKDGVVHYSQRAPEQGQNAEIITTKTPRAPLPEEMAPTTDAAPAVAESTDSDKPAAAKTAAPAVAQKDQASCDKALKAIEDLQKPIIMNEGKIMTIDEKNTEIQRMQEIVKVHCP